MPKESSVIRLLKSDYETVGLNIERTYKKTELLLKMYRKVNWSVSSNFNDLNEITYESSLGNSALSYLLNFAPDRELEVFQVRAENVMQTKVLVDLINKAVTKVRDYPEVGSVYYSIFDLRYLNKWSYREDEILEMLDLERSTFYRRKKEATYLLGYILFGFVMPEYVQVQKQYCN